MSTCQLENVTGWGSEFKALGSDQIEEMNFQGLPMLTEGRFLYVFARKRMKLKDSGESKSPLICVSIYSIEQNEGSAPNFKYER